MKRDKKIRVCFLVHAGSPFSTRMFYKEALSLRDAGYEVYIVAPSEKKFQEVQGIKIRGIQARRSKWRRFLPLKDLYRTGRALHGDIYSCHSLEALLVGVLLKKRIGTKVVFSAREYYPESYASESPWIIKPLVKNLMYVLEWYLCKQTDYVTPVWKDLCEKFQQWTDKTVLVGNYPVLGIIQKWRQIVEQNSKEKVIIYLGGIHPVKGVFEMIEAMSYVRLKFSETKLFLVGPCYSQQIEKKVKIRIKKFGLADVVKLVGKVDYMKAGKYLSKADIGLKLDYPRARNIHVPGNKFFEYCGMGLPVVASNIPATRKIIDKEKCGILVNPKKPKEIAEAVIYLLQHPREAQAMEERGKKAVLEKYNWERESKKMLQVYEELVGKPQEHFGTKSQ